MTPQQAVQQDWVMFTLYSFRVDGAKSRVDINDIWRLLAADTSAFNGYPDFFDCLTRLRQSELIDLTYPAKKTLAHLTFHGLDIAAAVYHARKRMIEDA